MYGDTASDMWDSERKSKPGSPDNKARGLRSQFLGHWVVSLIFGDNVTEPPHQYLL